MDGFVPEDAYNTLLEEMSKRCERIRKQYRVNAIKLRREDHYVMLPIVDVYKTDDGVTVIVKDAIPPTARIERAHL